METSLPPSRSEDSSLSDGRLKIRSPSRPERSCRLPSPSATVHQIKELVTVKEIDAWLFGGLPTSKFEPCSVFWSSLNERLPQKVICNGLQSTSFTDSLLLDSLQEIIINRERRATHA